MAKRHRSAAQKAATRRMLAANRSRKHRNPSPARRTYHKVAHRRNPSPIHHDRRRRNPSSTGGGGLFKELMSKEGLMQVGVIAGMPTLTELLAGYVAPSSTGYTRVAIKGGLGLAVAWALYQFVNKTVGLTAGLVAAGTAAAEGIHAYQASSTIATAAPATAGYLQGLRPHMHGYGIGSARQSEPGVFFNRG